jgi:general L-amino acid transport system permease protein
MNRSKRWWWQLIIVLVLLTVMGILINNLAVNLIRTGLGLSFDWLWRPAGFALR